jgi:hypothetical protein
MVNLKPVYDAAVAADAKVSEIMAEMVAHLEENTEEGKQQALALRETLDAAKAEAKVANELYVQMRDAQVQTDESARKFVPVPGAEKQAGQVKQQITRAEYEAMPAMEKGKFLAAGGMVVDEIRE